MRKQVGLLAAVFALCASSAGATSLVYNDFSSVAGLQLNGSAAQVGNVLRLTPAATGQSGTAFSTSAITLFNDYSFSTFFSFQISSVPNSFGDGDGPGADGITFIVQTNANTAGSGGGGIGYQGIGNSIAVEYDTYNNGGFANDPDGNHVGVDLGGNIASVATTPVLPRLNDHQVWYSWVDYNGVTDLLEVRLSLINSRPALPLLSYSLDLGAQLGVANAFVGFGSGTGSGIGNHDILSWEFRDQFDPINSAVPEPGTLSLLGLGSLVRHRVRGLRDGQWRECGRRIRDTRRRKRRFHHPSMRDPHRNRNHRRQWWRGRRQWWWQRRWGRADTDHLRYQRVRGHDPGAGWCRWWRRIRRDGDDCNYLPDAGRRSDLAGIRWQYGDCDAYDLWCTA
jgi:hypothetical protein